MPVTVLNEDLDAVPLYNLKTLIKTRAVAALEPRWQVFVLRVHLYAPAWYVGSRGSCFGSFLLFPTTPAKKMAALLTNPELTATH